MIFGVDVEMGISFRGNAGRLRWNGGTYNIVCEEHSLPYKINTIQLERYKSLIFHERKEPRLL